MAYLNILIWSAFTKKMHGGVLILTKTKRFRLSLNEFKKVMRQVLHDYRTQAVVFIFILIILVGGFLLSLPGSVRSGKSTSFIDSIFTATSAVCVTGLTVVDTYSHWSTFGQVVILILIQIGGLGFMSIATLLFLFLRKTISLNQRLLIQESLSYDVMEGIIDFVKRIILVSLVTELIGASLLSIRFIPEYGWSGGIYKSIFHSVSAFCNAGFDIMGTDGGMISLYSYRDDWLVCGTIMGLIVWGGLGFMVWGDLLKFHSHKRWKLHTKVVIITSFVLIISGTVMFYIFEYSNNLTVGNLSWWQKILPALFQSVTTRTAGFATINQGDLTDASFVLSMLFMFVGGSPGSTAGGIKTTTFCIIILAISKMISGERDLNVFGRRIHTSDIVRSFIVASIACFIILFGIVFICLGDRADLKYVVYEIVSAFGTVGLSVGVTPYLSVFGKSILIFTMFVGRVGVLAFALTLLAKSNSRKKESFRYPVEHIIIG